MTITDPATDYASDEDAEQDLFPGSEPLPGMPAGATAAPAPEERPVTAPARPRRAPGPRPNPNSGRQRKIQRAQERAKTAPAPARKSTPNKPAPAPTLEEVYHRGAMTILGWLAEPAGAAGMGMLLTAAKKRNLTPRRRQQLTEQGLAFTLDAATIAVYGDELAEGAAELAASGAIPWAAAVLERAAKISPYAGFVKIGTAMLLQVFVNHGLIPVGLIPSTMDPQELLDEAGIELPGFVAGADVPGEGEASGG